MSQLATPADNSAIRIGDRVVCVDDRQSFYRLRNGEIYIVEANFDGSPTVMVNQSSHCLERFKKIASCTCNGVFLGGEYPGSHLPGCPVLCGKRGMTEAEFAIMRHCSMFGSEGYGAYINKLKSGWTWGTEKVAGPPIVFATKCEAVASFEAFLQVLRDAQAGRL